MKAAATTSGAAAAATGAGAVATSTTASPSPSTMRRTLLLASTLASLGLLAGVGLLVGKGKAPAAGSRFLAQRVLVRSSTTTTAAAPARRLSVPVASLTGPLAGWWGGAGRGGTRRLSGIRALT